jgi:hypothetical protein
MFLSLAIQSGKNNSSHGLLLDLNLENGMDDLMHQKSFG